MKLSKPFLLLFVFAFFIFACQNDKINDKEQQVYVCPPCACAAHANGGNETFDHDDACPYCGMQLTEKPDSSEIGQVNIETGSGNFLVEGGAGHKEKTITVFYHKPESFRPESSILFVIPGSGRDGDEYRDAWIKASEKHGLLVLSPRYPEESYGFGGYHMGGLMYDMKPYKHIRESENSNELFLNEETFTFKVNQNQAEWIFNDFDRIFDMVVDSVGSTRQQYDIFGHSAGGQILHRFVLFQPQSKAKRILASNSGFYTMPETGTQLPFGLKNTPVTLESLKTSFEEQLILFIGEEDNEDEMGGILLRSPTVDRQGTHRLERSQYFYQQSKTLADSLETPFNWKREVIPGVGHEFRKMSEAAAEYLYGDKKKLINGN